MHPVTNIVINTASAALAILMFHVLHREYRYVNMTRTTLVAYQHNASKGGFWTRVFSKQAI